MNHSHRPIARAGLAGVLAACAGASVLAGNAVEVIYTKIATHPSSIVPIALDLNGDPVETNWRALEDIILSPDGSRWILKGRTNQGSSIENIMLLGAGDGSQVAHFAQGRQPIPDGAAGEVYDFFGSGLGRFNDQNQFAYSARATGGLASVFQKVIVYTGGMTPSPSDYQLVTQMGDLYTGLVDSGANPSGDETVGNSVGSIHILNDGTVGSQDSSIQNINSLRRPAIFYDNDALLQRGWSTVVGLDGSSVFTVKNLSANGFYTSPNGESWIAQGQIETGGTTNDDVLLLNGQVVLQEGSAIGTSGVVVGTIVTSGITSSGEWYARGAILGGGVWAAINGVVVARTGETIATGEGENWGASFLSFSVNNNGDWLLVGTTDSADPATDTVMVLNGERVLVREGDAVDLPGFDGPVLIGRGNLTAGAFEPNDSILTDDLVVYFLASIHDGMGNDYNSTPAFGAPQAFMRLDAGASDPCPGDSNGDGVVNFADLNAVLSDFGQSGMGLPGDVNGDGVVNFQDLNLVLSNFGATCK
ncbi:MAG: hypothetical protein KF684_02685 [Phycisphaeraceae bacterium]|nr:hypothetical protein [Phycisphaeraceae bacterium]